LRRIDVTVATKNNERTLDRCLKSITENIPLRHLIVVDGGSTDRTVDIARRYNARVVTEGGLLGKVRYRQGMECCTDWIAFVDSDIYVYPSWWPRVSIHMKEEVGMIVGTGEGDKMKPSRPQFYEKYFEYKTKKYGAEAFSNTLVKRHLLLSCKQLLRNVHAGEDSVFARHVREMGKQVITVKDPNPLCFHDHKQGELTSAFFRSGQSIGITRNHRRLFQTFASTVRDWYEYSSNIKNYDPRLLVYVLCLWGYLAKGYVMYQELIPQTRQKRFLPRSDTTAVC